MISPLRSSLAPSHTILTFSGPTPLGQFRKVYTLGAKLIMLSSFLIRWIYEPCGLNVRSIGVPTVTNVPMLYVLNLGSDGFPCPPGPTDIFAFFSFFFTLLLLLFPSLGYLISSLSTA